MSLGPHLLGRVPPPDDSHVRSYALALPTVSNVEVEIKRPTLSLYDQGDTPRCVGYSISKIMNHYNGYAFDADWLYAECKKIDGYPGDGTNARAACDVLRREGHWRTIRGCSRRPRRIFVRPCGSSPASRSRTTTSARCC